MKKKLLLSVIVLFVATIAGVYFFNSTNQSQNKNKASEIVSKKKKTLAEKMLFSQKRVEHELKFQRDPMTGEIPVEEKKAEYANAVIAKQKAITQRTTGSTYISRGPSNLGGRTRAFAIDISDATSQTILAGGVSSGLFRTTNGGASWTKVSANDEIHNVTAIAQDPRPGFQNTWYYATGERSGNSASAGSAGFYFGQGIWKSTDGGITWAQISQTNSNFTSFDTDLDLISAIEVNPTNGDLMIAAFNRIYRFDGTSLTPELSGTGGSSGLTDIEIISTGRVYAAFAGDTDSSTNGVWTSPTGNGSWTRVAQNGSPAGWSATGRIVLGKAPSNTDIIYALYVNGSGHPNIEGDLWQYNHGTTTWTNFSSKLPDEPNGDSVGNDPFAVQGGYDLVVSVKPDDENFVLIGGTNAYKIANIITDSEFERIGGYLSNTSYDLYAKGGDEHHPDIHALVFDPNNPNILFSGTDGGVHKTTDINAATVTWTNLNNDYQTYQYYHVALDPKNGANAVLGGAQDNGTTVGGTDATFFGLTDNTTMEMFAGGDGVAVGIERTGSDELLYYLGVQNGPIYRLSNPFTGAQINPTGASSQFITYFYLDPDNTNALYYAGLSTLYRTTNTAGVTSGNWTNMGTLTTGENLRTFATTRGTYNPSSSYLLIGGERGGIFRLNDPQNAASLASAVNITPPGATVANDVVVSGLAIHPTNPDIVLAVYSNYSITNIFLTTNATDANPTWTNVEQNLSAHSIRSAAITTVGSEVIYFVGTARGLYSSNDPTSKDWDIEGINQIGLAVVSGLVYRPSDNKLLIGTHGNGMFETTVEGTLSNDDIALGELGIKMYPNPAHIELNIVSNEINDNDKVDYRITDLTGKTIQQGVISNKKVNISKLKSGIYLMNVKVDKKRQTLKFIKN